MTQARPIFAAIGRIKRDGGRQLPVGAPYSGSDRRRIRGAQSLLRRGGRFTHPTGRSEVLDGWRMETNPVLDWMQDNLHVGCTKFVFIVTLPVVVCDISVLLL